MNWQSPAIPPTIRRPWQVFQEDLEDKMIDCESQGADVGEGTRNNLAMMQSHGAFATFADLAADTQRTYCEVSLTELAAYVNWRSKQEGASAETPMEFEAGWDLLDCDAKAEWIVDDPTAFLAEADSAWQPLLAGGQASALGVDPTEEPPPVKAEPPGDAAAAQQKKPPVKAEAASDAAVVQKPLKGEPAASDAAVVQKPLKAKPAAEAASDAAVVQKPLKAKPAAEDAAVVQKPLKAKPAAEASASNKNAREAATLKGTQRLRTATTRQPKAKEQEDSEEKDGESEESEADLDGALKEAEAVVGRGRDRPVTAAVAGRGQKRKLAAENCCPEVDDAVCCVCKKDDHSPHNDLVLCDKCDRGFHQLCHDPPVAHLGSLDDQWFCRACTQDLAHDRGLKAKVGDFVWVTYMPKEPLWPARVHQLDFVSLADPKPYWVQFFETGAPTGSWVGESQLKLWSQGPTFGDIKDSRRRLAVRMAEGDGASPISSNLAQAPIKPIIIASRQAHEEALRRPQAAVKNASGDIPAKRSRQSTTKSPPRRPLKDPANPEDLELQSQVSEMRNMVREARERQARLEQQVDEAMSQSQRT